MRSREQKYLTRALIILGGCILAVGTGLACFEFSFAEPIRRLSYDLPFIARSTLDTREIALVYLDEDSAKQLHQPLDNSWNRALHTQLLDRLAHDKARLVFYDIVFDAPADPASDEAFAESIRRHGRVVLGAALETFQPIGGVQQQRVLPPTKLLRKAAAAWGLLAFKPIDSDYGVRQLFPGTGDIPTATWKAVEMLGGKVAQGPRETASPRWINYYGPPNTFSSVNFVHALAGDGVPPGYFNDRIVLVGGRSTVSYLGAGRDEFVTPYSLANHPSSTGLEVHATILLNLLRGEWLTRMSMPWEIGIIVLFGLLAGGLAGLRPVFAVIAAVIGSLAIASFATWLVWNQRLWFNWAVPAGVELPLGLVWSVGAQYLLEARRRKKLRHAFSLYLSPHMADQIANSNFDLKPGGKLVEATVMFTDLENFTGISESLEPTQVAELLIEYFEQTSRCILDNNGMIIDYVGDAVMAAWGAPVEEPAHPMRAAEAACDLQCLAELNVQGKKLRTRVGLHTGKVLAGNLGSSFRFDYTMIGDTTNFASRLESMNKYLHTQVLISDAVKRQIHDKFITRRLGEFRVAGKTQSIVVHELICRCEDDSGDHPWIEVFEEGLSVFKSGEFAAARLLMERTRKIHGGSDGPAEFYLKKIEALEADGHQENWTGVIALTEK